MFERGRLADAAACYENTVRIAPDLVEARICLGRVYLQLGRWHDAVECFQQVIRENPVELDAHIQMGRALEVRDLLGDALAYFEAALKIEPGPRRGEQFRGQGPASAWVVLTMRSLPFEK